MMPTSTENIRWPGIETYTGELFDLDNPKFNIEDIAHALSLTTRYGGHSKKFYSVAEHSVLVSEILEQWGDPYLMEGLMHDASEAYLSDVPAPFKRFLPDWKKIDKELEIALAKHYDLKYPRSANNKAADWVALFIEAYDLLPSKGIGWFWQDPEQLRGLAIDYRTNHEFQAYCWSPRKAEKRFLRRYYQLGGTAA